MSESTSTTDPLSQRFELRRDLAVRAETFGGRLGYIIEDPLNGKFFQIGEAECRFLRFFDGKRTLQEVIAESSSLQFAELQLAVAFSQAEALVLVRWAGSRGLLVCDDGGATSDSGSPTPSETKPPFNPFFIRLPLDSPHRKLESLSRLLGGAFSATGAILFALIWICLLAYVAPRASDILRWETLWHPQNWIGLFATWLGLKALHELGHAVACRRFGGEIRSAGMALICFSPVAYVDATSAWRISSKWRRIVVSAAGMYFEAWAAALAVLVAILCPNDFVRTWASHIALVAGGQTLLVNVNPFVRFDGYYILADLFELPNLHGLSRQAATNVLRRLSGDSQALDVPLVGKHRVVIAAYAWAASAWKLCLAIGVCTFFLAQREILGGPLATFLAVLWLALPLWTMRRELKWIRDWKPQTNRLIFGGAAIGITLITAGCWLLQPAVIRAEGVVDFSPMTVLRAPHAGFVRQVLAAKDEHVAAGDPILVIASDELTYEASDLRLQVLQSQAKIRMLGAQQLLAQRASEEATCRALETRLAELEDKLEEMTVRAPHSGRVIARDIEQLAGRFLAPGEEIAILGGDEALHVVAVIAQDELNAVNKPQIQAHIDFSTTCRPALSSESVRFEPAAQMNLPHEALSGVNGGPIAMRQTSAAADGRARYEPLAPVFVAYIPLPLTLQQVSSGERAAVRFTSPGYTRAARLLDCAWRWFQKV